MEQKTRWPGLALRSILAAAAFIYPVVRVLGGPANKNGWQPPWRYAASLRLYSRPLPSTGAQSSFGFDS